jgi:hypothetical protein
MSNDRFNQIAHAAKAHVEQVSKDGADFHGSLCSLRDLCENGTLGALGALDSDTEQPYAMVTGRAWLRKLNVL